MTDRHDDMARRGAELADCSLRTRSAAAELMAESEQLARRSAETRNAGARVLQQVRERRARGTAASTGGGPDRLGPAPGSLAGEVPVTWLEPGAVMLDPGEAAALAALLEELAVRDRRDPLCARALQAAALLRQRAAAGYRHGLRPRPGGPQGRREAGDTRDDSADDRDVLAADRDRRADDRDDRSAERDRLADDADTQARATEQHVRDLLRDAELRDKDAAEHAGASLPAADGAGGQQWQLEQELAEAGRARNFEDREAIRDMLSQAGDSRHAARSGRHTDGQDRLASHRDRRSAHADRQAATADRQASRADRDQTVIETEEESPPGTVPGA